MNQHPLQAELDAKITEMLEALKEREGEGYAKIIASMYSMSSLSHGHPAFGPVAQQLIAGFCLYTGKGEDLEERMCNDFNMLIRTNLDVINRKRNEPPST